MLKRYQVPHLRPFPTFLVMSMAILTILLSLSKGSTSTPFYQLLFAKNSQFSTLFWQLRLPRTLSAFVSGGLLALAGALMQVLLENPLADPYALGISSGAAFATLVGILLGLSPENCLTAAWIGSLSIMGMMMLLNRRHDWRTQTLLLTGMTLACGLSAAISFLLLISTNSNLHSMLFWLSGDLNRPDIPWVGLITLGIGLLASVILAPSCNLLMHGEREARALGLNSGRYRFVLYLLCSFFTATAVTIGGCIGFVGLIVPHYTRLLFGADHRILLPYSLFLGGTLVTLADTLARTLFAPEQIPVGIMMACIGVPLLIGRLWRC